MEKIISQKSFNPFTKAVKALHGELSATPERIVKEMFNKLDRIDWKNPDLKILDPAAGFGTFLREAYIRLKEFHSEEYILNNMLYACEISGFNALFMEKKMGLRNIYKGDFLTMRLPDGWPKEFDYVLCNPPYSNGMDLKFLGKAIEICKGEIVFVHPASSYIHKNKKYSKINDQVSSYLKDLVFFNGNPIFDILLFIPCAITHLSKLHNENSFSFDDRINSVNKILRKEDLSKISSFGLNESYNSLYSKIDHHTKRI
jgi:predicted RNA methylase